MEATTAERSPTLNGAPLPEPAYKPAGPELLKAMHDARRDMQAVPQSGHNKFDDYDYSTNADFVTAVEVALDKAGLYLRHDLVNVEDLGSRKNHRNNDEQVRRVTIRSTLIHVATMQATWTDMPCEGMDPRDKAILKANTGAKKYAISNLFDLKSGIDPEINEDGRNAPPRERTNEQQRGDRRGQQTSKPATTTQATLNLNLPPGWPNDTPVADIVKWINSIPATVAAFKTCLLILKDNKPLYDCIEDWDTVLRALGARFKAQACKKNETDKPIKFKDRDSIWERKVKAEFARIEAARETDAAFKDQPLDQTTGTEATHEPVTTASSN